LDKNNVKKLIEYITKEPTEDEHKRGHKYPFISAEILNAEISKILDFFLIPDSEMEMKDKILKNIDNELSFSDDFPDVKRKSAAKASIENTEEAQIKSENNEFVDVVEEENADKEPEETENKENESSENEPEKASAEEEIKKKVVEGDGDINKIENLDGEVESQQAEKGEDENLSENKNENENNKEVLAVEAFKAEESSDKIELLEFLLEFIETSGELNYVLAGYFSKFFIALLNRNSGSVNFF